MAGRPKVKNKKKKTTVYLEPELLEAYKKYCEEQGIENYSEHIESLIKKRLKNEKIIYIVQ